MKFIPEKAHFINKLVIIITSVIIVMVLILRFSENSLTKSLMILLIIMSLIYSSYSILFLKTFYYKIEDGILSIESVFKFTNKYIMLGNIEFFTERITLLNQSGIAGMLSKRFSIGKGYIKGLGKVDMYITSSKKTIFFGTENGNYAISPANMSGFSALLKKNGIKEEFVVRDVLEKDIQESEDILKNLFLLNAVIALILIQVPLALLFLNKLPEYVSISQLDTSMLSYVPAKVYVDSTVIYGIIAFLITVLAYVFSRVYSKIDKIYYYRVMLIPLVITFLLLLKLANTLIPIFM